MTAHYQKENGLIEVRREGTEAVDGILCDKVFTHIKTSYAGSGMEYHTTWFIGQKDSLVRRQVQRVDFEGKKGYVRDSTLRRIIVNSSWCPPCVASMPHNQAVMKKLQRENLPVVLLALDNSEPREPFLKWVGEHKEMDALTFAYADPEIAKIAGDLYKVTGIPTQYVIDAKGIIRDSTAGFGGPTDALEKSVRKALKE
jgi:thiol-disulfide isomerase/thioredoxin